MIQHFFFAEKEDYIKLGTLQKEADQGPTESEAKIHIAENPIEPKQPKKKNHKIQQQLHSS